MPYISSISFRLSVHKPWSTVDLRGRNFIFTGKNGSGKTSLLNRIHSALWNSVGFEEKVSSLRAELKTYQSSLSYLEISNNLSTGLLDSQEIKNQRAQGISSFKLRIADVQFKIEHAREEAFSGIWPDITLSNPNAIRDARITDFYRADRLSDIVAANAAYSSPMGGASLGHNSNVGLGNGIEQHLLNLFVRRSLAHMDRDSNIVSDKIFHEISDWLEKFNEKIKFLLEDSSASVEFNSNDLKVCIIKGDAEKISFQGLSSGYSAVFNILFSMLLRAQQFSTLPNELVGIVFIDEIDVHLHVSLQQKIFPFLTGLFPKVQFIITTHSPFVLASVNDAVIFDLDSSKIATDLSLYTSESIVEGMFGLKNESIILQKKIEKLSDLSDESKNFNYSELFSLVKQLEGVRNNLDEESQFFLNKAILLLQRKK